MPINSGIDMEMYRLARYDSIKMFSTKEDWVIDMGVSSSLIKTKNRRLKTLKLKLRDLKNKLPRVSVKQNLYENKKYKPPFL
jgi:hypothetical protein